MEDYDDIVVAAGSVGTVCGLAVAKYLTGAKIKRVKNCDKRYLVIHSFPKKFLKAVCEY